MADQVCNTETPENLSLPTPGCPILIAIPALGNNLPNLSGMAAPVLSNLWIQPPFPHLPAHLLAGNASLQSFVPPGVSHLQTIHGEQLQLANLTPCNPPVSTFPQPFYTPLPPQYQTLPGPGTIQKIPRPSYPQHRLSGHSEAQATSDVGLQLGQRWPLELPTSQPASLQEIRAPEEEPQKAQSYHLPGSLDQPRSSLHQFVGSPLAPSSSLHYDLEDIPHLLPVLEVDQDLGGHPSGASLKTEVPQASRDQEASEPDPSKNFGLNDGGPFQPSSKGKGKRKIPWIEEEPPAKKSKRRRKLSIRCHLRPGQKDHRETNLANISLQRGQQMPRNPKSPLVFWRLKMSPRLRCLLNF
ncbi:uncharacterized protein LOC117656902 isoform X1 [Pantherophis guttatus]|uniref:Uncharacterized protein LOC117656902 isoform X1 n=2 Tax=Pantherophis guttatus TaxID=94885 RepID=A0ABM3YT86_PANGU|nr:uncharacterized protein LOC117656902 isoform X1 [Pantherophis guttatus]